MKTDKIIREILSSARQMMLATSSDGNSTATAVSFATEGDHLLFFSFTTSREAGQIHVNPHVQALIESPDPNQKNTLQIEGLCYRIKKPQEQKRAYQMLAARAQNLKPLMEDPFLRKNKVTGYYRLIPTAINLLDGEKPMQANWHETTAKPIPTVIDFAQTVLKRISVWIRAVRAPFFTASIVPVLIGSVIAYIDLMRAGGLALWSWTNFWLVLIGAVFSQAGTNLGNDYFDHTSKNDEQNDFSTPFNGGSRIIQNGLIKPWKIFFAAVFFFVATMAIGFHLNNLLNGFSLSASPLLWLGLLGVALGFLYTGHPVRLGYHGWGELSVALGFGPVMVLGAHYVLTAPLINSGQIVWEWQMPLLASVPVAVLIMLVVWINQFQDLPADKLVGKNTWVVRLAGIKDNHVDYGRPFLYYMYFNYFSFGFIFFLGMVGFFIPALSTPFVLISLLPVILSHQAIKQGKAWLDLWNDPSADRRKLPFELLKVNVSTIGVHLLTGGLLALGYWIQILVD